MQENSANTRVCWQFRWRANWHHTFWERCCSLPILLLCVLHWRHLLCCKSNWRDKVSCSTGYHDLYDKGSMTHYKTLDGIALRYFLVQGQAKRRIPQIVCSERYSAVRGWWVEESGVQMPTGIVYSWLCRAKLQLAEVLHSQKLEIPAWQPRFQQAFPVSTVLFCYRVIVLIEEHWATLWLKDSLATCLIQFGQLQAVKIVSLLDSQLRCKASQVAKRCRWWSLKKQLLVCLLPSFHDCNTQAFSYWRVSIKLCIALESQEGELLCFISTGLQPQM